MKASLLGVPLDLGAENLGVDIGPEAFRAHKLEQKLASCGIDLKDLGDAVCADRASLKPGNSRLRYLDEIVRVNLDVAHLVDKTIADGSRAIVLGGDHSLTIGTVAGAAAGSGELGLIYFDAHGDMNTNKTTLTGNIHGMPLSAAMGFGAKELTDLYKPGSKIKPANLLHIGGSDFDQAELDLIRDEKLDCFTLFDVLRQGLDPLVRKIDELGKRVDKVWVSLDFDAIDSVYAPGAGMPSKAGLSYREIMALADYIGKTCPVVGLDIVEYNPLQDEDRKTAELGAELIARFLGRNYSWYSNYMESNRLK